MKNMSMEQADKLTITDYLPKCPEKESDEFKRGWQACLRQIITCQDCIDFKKKSCGRGAWGRQPNTYFCGDARFDDSGDVPLIPYH